MVLQDVGGLCEEEARVLVLELVFLVWVSLSHLLFLSLMRRISKAKGDKQLMLV